MKIVDGQVYVAATDVSNHVSCAHLTTLNAQLARGSSPGTRSFDELATILAERGRVHEAAFAENLRSQQPQVVAASDGDSLVDLMTAGTHVITQARMTFDRWVGQADFLLRVDRPCARWAWSYEIIDTKLATNTKAGAVLQLCFYSELLGTVQGTVPDRMHIIKPGPDFPRETFRFEEYAAIYRLVRADLLEQLADPANTYPQPTGHCEICEWRGVCESRRRSDDHLSLVADLSRHHRRELTATGIRTLTALAGAPLPWPQEPRRGLKSTYEGLVQQARLQLQARSVAVAPYEVLQPKPDRGLSRLPLPDAGDVFLDLEGDPFIGTGGREYLFGWVAASDGYRCVWTTSDSEERSAFEALIDDLTARLDARPGMHVYHYASYETTAMKRLSSRYGSRIDELDRLLRGKKFIDLHSITRQSVRAGVETYSIKALEPIIGFARSTHLATASVGLRGVRLALQRGLPNSIDPIWRQDVEAYNRDDCEAARALRDWLEQRRSDFVNLDQEISRPPLLSGQQQSVPEKATVASAAAASLLANVSADRGDRSVAENARWLLGHMLDWYRRESRAAWWEFFRLATLTDHYRIEEQRALAGLEHIERVADSKRVLDRYRYPAQDFMLSEGEALWIDEDVQIGTLAAIDADERVIEIRRKAETMEFHPTSVFAHTIVPPLAKRQALLSIAGDVIAHGFKADDRPSVTRDILFQASPRDMNGESLRRSGESIDECARRLALALNGTVLPIQGPPGSGKTETAAKMIVALVRSGKRVGVTATSHAVIENLVARALSVAAQEQFSLRALLKSDEQPAAQRKGIEYTSSASVAEKKVRVVHLLGATPWQWARETMVGAVDVLFIDEAGQMSLADALSVSRSAESIVLVGDPQQLEQPIVGIHPEGLAVSVLEHMLCGRETISPDRGLFLEETHRLHPAICSFTSEQFYERRLRCAAEAAVQDVRGMILSKPGLYWLPVEHHECINRSPEEADAIASLLSRVLRDDATWLAPGGQESKLTPQDILVVAPFNAHVSTIRDALAAKGIVGVRVGTVDKFQGQEAPVAIYSMATSVPEDAPRGLSFLYDRHRLNVATSRARCASVLVCSEALLRPNCETPMHLHLASALCRYVELAERLVSG